MLNENTMVRVSTTFSGNIPGLGQGPINNPISIARRELDRAIAMGYKRYINIHDDKPAVVKPTVVTPKPVAPKVNATKPEAIVELEQAVAKPKMIKVTIGGEVKEMTEADATALRNKVIAEKAAKAAK